MTDNEITVKALKDLLEVMLCEGDLQRVSTVSHAIEHINRLKAEIERLGKELEVEKNQVIRLENQVGRLLSMNQAKLDTIHDLQEENNWYSETLNTTKAKAYKECIEKVKELIGGWGDLEYHSEAINAENDLDNLLKEMVGGKP